MQVCLRMCLSVSAGCFDKNAKILCRLMPAAHIPVFRLRDAKDMFSGYNRTGDAPAPVLFPDKNAEKVESCVAQQYPVKDSVKSDQHYHKPLEELPETEMFAYAVPRAENDRTAHKHKRKHDHHPADSVLTAEALRLYSMPYHILCIRCQNAQREKTVQK